MLRKKLNRDTLNLNQPNDPINQRLSYVKDILSDSSFFPKTVKYRDIDEAFLQWVEDELKITFEETKLPTFALFSNQRYSEYMQMWSDMDNNNNLKLNFKVITRENNPKTGTMYGSNGRIPTATKYLVNRIEALNDQGKTCAVEYRMAQPVTIDLMYKITLVTNKYELLNEFNIIVNDRFSGLQAYLYPNSHPMPMKLKNISDESEYNVDDRQYFAQTYEIQVMAYIITEDYFDIEVKPIVSIHCIGGDIQKRKPQVEIEEFEIINTCPKDKKERYYNQPMKITVNYSEDDLMGSDFTIDCNMNVVSIITENIKTYIVKVNDNTVIFDDEVELKNGDIISLKIKKINRLKPSKLIIEGYSPDIIYDSKEDNPEIESDNKNVINEIIVD